MSGVFRDMAMAFCFGSAPEIAAFMVAYRLSNLFRRLFGEGNLQSGFVPQFESLPGETALRFYRDTSFSLLALLLGAVAVMEGGLLLAAYLLNPDWAEIALLAMWMAPGLIFICLYALNSAFLQCRKSYFIPAAAPALFNIAWIGAALASHRFPVAEAVRYLSIGIAAAFAFQWAMTAIQVRKEIAMPWKEWFRPQIFSPEWKKLIKPLSLGVVGIGAMQINSALDAIFARIADLSGPAYLWYAIRLQQLPLALFGIALSGALLPPLSRAMREGALERYSALLKTGLRHSAALMIPCTFGIFAVGASGLNLLYGHGDFTPSDVARTLHCLWGYAIGLLPSVFVLLLATGYYARKSYSLPTFASVLSVLFNAGLNALLVFVFHWGAVSIAISTSAAAWVNCAILARGLGQRSGALYLARLSFCGIVASAFSLLMGHFFLGDATFTGDFTRSSQMQLIQFGGMAIFFLGSFFSTAYLLRVRELFDLLKQPV